MGNFYSNVSKIFLTLLSVFVLQAAVAQPTTLVAGDIAFTGYNATANSPQSDAFSFVLLRAMNAGTIIRFTDNAWGNNSAFRTGEQTVSLTLGGNYPAGVEITVSGVPSATTITATIAGSSTSAGTATGNMLSLSVNGDQVIAYQSATAGTAPFTFISAIHMNVYVGAPDPSTTTAATWDNVASGTQTVNSSFIPTGLTNATDAIWIGTQGVISSERNNARFNCNTATAGGANLLTIAGIRAACNNQAFWDAEFAASGAATSWPLPSTCNYMNILLPVRLISFQAQNNIDEVTASWQVTNEVDLNNYELERSFNNKDFDKIATLPANHNGGSGISTYTYADRQSLNNGAAIIYYRLKMNDRDGKFNYSEIVAIKNKKGASFIVDKLANPVKDRLNFTLTTKTATRADIQLADASGRIVASRTVQTTAGTTAISMPETMGLSQGVYFLRITVNGESTVTRFVK
jgi:hypothetical protein